MLDKTGGTAMQGAFAKAGLRPEVVEFDRAIAQFLNNGGTIEEAQARLDLARVKLSGGAISPMPQGLPWVAPPRQPVSSGEARRSVPQGQLEPANSLRPIANGEGHTGAADKASMPTPPVIREPSKAQISAAAAVAKTIAINAFDRELTRTGQRWGNVRYRDLDEMLEDADIAQRLKAHIGALRGDDRHKTIRELMTPREFAILIGKVRK